MWAVEQINHPWLTSIGTHQVPASTKKKKRQQNTQPLNHSSKKHFYNFYLESLSWHSVSIFLFPCFIPSCKSSPFRPHQSPFHCSSQTFLSKSPPLPDGWEQPWSHRAPTPFPNHCGEGRIPFLTKVLCNFSLDMSRFNFLLLQLRTPWKEKCNPFFLSQHVITYGPDMACSIFTAIFVPEKD